jgi:hypothetical protein
VYGITQRERIARARQLHRNAGIPDDAANVAAAVIVLGIAILIIVLCGVFNSVSNNITCKGTNGVQYWLCIAGQAGRQYVTYDAWRSARVGGYFDPATHKLFRDVSEDPAAPHGLLGGHGGGSGDAHVTVVHGGGDG